MYRTEPENYREGSADHRGSSVGTGRMTSVMRGAQATVMQDGIGKASVYRFHHVFLVTAARIGRTLRAVPCTSAQHQHDMVFFVRSTTFCSKTSRQAADLGPRISDAATKLYLVYLCGIKLA